MALGHGMVLPTLDVDVQERLRELGEPITLFGEVSRDRRDRLRRVLQSRGLSNGMPSRPAQRDASDDNDGDDGDDHREEFFAPAPGAGGRLLRGVRTAVAYASAARAQRRLAEERTRRAAVETEVAAVAGAIQAYSLDAAGPDDADNQRRFRAALDAVDGPLSARKRHLQQLAGSLAQRCSVIGDARPLSACALSSRGDLLAVGAWSNACSLWQVGTTVAAAAERPARVLHGHQARITDLQWRYSRQFRHHFDDPAAAQLHADLLVSADANGVLLLWQLPSTGDDNGAPITASPFAGRHAERVNRLAWHPGQSLVASTSHDLTWRLWDVETRLELVAHEGHSKAVFGVAFHPDGSLACSTGEDALVRLWDVRTGKCVAHHVEHSQQVYCATFHPDGVQLATAGADNQVRVWDLRRAACRAVVPAHRSAVSRLHYDSTGHCLVSAGFDRKLRLWSTSDYSRVVSLSAHTAKIMGMAVDTTESHSPRIFTAAYDRSWALITTDSI